MADPTPKISLEAVEAVEQAIAVLGIRSPITTRGIAERAVEVAYPAIRSSVLEDLKRELLSEQRRRIAGRGLYEDVFPWGDWESLALHERMSWEGNAAAGIEAVLDSLASEGGERQ